MTVGTQLKATDIVSTFLVQISFCFGSHGSLPSDLTITVDWVAQTIQRLATGWRVRGSNPGGGEIFCTCSDRPWGPASLLYNGYRVFPRGKERPGRDADPSSPSSAVGQENVQLYFYSPYGPYGLYRASVPVQGCTLHLLYNHHQSPLLIIVFSQLNPIHSLEAYKYCSTVSFNNIVSPTVGYPRVSPFICPNQILARNSY